MNNLFGFKERWTFPAGAAAFMNQQAPSPNCFSHYSWGGYLSFAVPGFKTFVDGRGLVEELSTIYDETLKGIRWQETFDRYNINTVIMPGMSEASGSAYPLVEALSFSTDWQLVFADDSALVFVRTIPANNQLIIRNSIDKRTVQAHLVRLSERLINENPDREGYWQTKADALQLLGDRQAALAAYRKTLQLNPDNKWALRMISIERN